MVSGSQTEGEQKKKEMEGGGELSNAKTRSTMPAGNRRLGGGGLLWLGLARVMARRRARWTGIWAILRYFSMSRQRSTEDF